MFVHEAKMVLPVVDAAIVVVDGVAGVEVVTQRVWNYCEEYKTPRLIVVNRMDRDRADAERVLESLTNAFGRDVIPIELPIGSEKSLTRRGRPGPHEGLHLRAGRKRQGQRNRNSRRHAGAVQEAHEMLVELVAEGDDELMEKFFEKGTIPEEDLIPALHNAIREDKIFPVIFSSGLGNIGADRVMDFIVDYTPAPSEHEWVQGEAPRGMAMPPKRHESDDRARVPLCLQDGVRCVRRAHFLLQGFLRRAEERRHAAELQPRQRRKSSRTFPSCRARRLSRCRSCTPATSARSRN